MVVFCFMVPFVRKKWIPKDFNDFVFIESSKILKTNSSISIDDLSKQIYDKWVEHVPNLPSKYRIPSKKGWWIVKPTVQGLKTIKKKRWHLRKIKYIKADTSDIHYYINVSKLLCLN